MPNFKFSPLTVSVVAACLLALGGALVFSGASRAADEPQAGQPRPALTVGTAPPQRTARGQHAGGNHGEGGGGKLEGEGGVLHVHLS